MRKLILPIVILFAIMTNAQSISLRELESFKTLPINTIQINLKDNGFVYYATKNGGTQWKAKDGSGIVGANGKGLVMLVTSNRSLEQKLNEEMKISSYKYNNTSNEGNLKVVSFKKGKTTILKSSTPNPDNGKLLYNITIIEKGS